MLTLSLKASGCSERSPAGGRSRVPERVGRLAGSDLQLVLSGIDLVLGRE